MLKKKQDKENKEKETEILKNVGEKNDKKRIKYCQREKKTSKKESQREEKSSRRKEKIGAKEKLKIPK